jgi:hypothetical protein
MSDRRYLKLCSVARCLNRAMPDHDLCKSCANGEPVVQYRAYDLNDRVVAKKVKHPRKTDADYARLRRYLEMDRPVQAKQIEDEIKDVDFSE